MDINQICQLGNAVNEDTGRLHGWRECAMNLRQESSLWLLCPLSSILIGYGRLKSLINYNFSNDRLCQRISKGIYFSITGAIAFLGLGSLIVIIRLFFSVIVIFIWVILLLFYLPNIICGLDIACLTTLIAPLQQCFNAFFPPSVHKRYLAASARPPLISRFSSMSTTISIN